jgi:hypothetical protein
VLNKAPLANVALLETTSAYSRSPIEANGPPSMFQLHVSFTNGQHSKLSPRKHELLTRSLKKMEKTLDTVLKSIGNPSMVSGMVSRSPSPTSQAAQTQALLATPSPPPQSAYPPSSSANASASPKLHCLPDNSLNPLGLLAEASLANRRAQGISSSFSARPADPDPDHKLGVASDNYFRPGS